MYIYIYLYILAFNCLIYGPRFTAHVFGHAPYAKRRMAAAASCVVDPVERTEAVDELRRMAWKRNGIIAMGLNHYNNNNNNKWYIMINNGLNKKTWYVMIIMINSEKCI